MSNISTSGGLKLLQKNTFKSHTVLVLKHLDYCQCAFLLKEVFKNKNTYIYFFDLGFLDFLSLDIHKEQGSKERRVKSNSTVPPAS